MRLLGACIIGFLVVGVARAGDSDRGQSRRSVIERDARALALKIDDRLAARWKATGLQPSARADDGEFLRRASLDLVGRIPTAAEARDFLDDPNPAKREALVDRLLESPAYAARAVLLWRQLLLPDSSDQAVAVATDGFDAWLVKKVAEDAGYDRIIREILAVKLVERNGRVMETPSIEPSPAAYYSAKGGKPETIAADSARAFLGLRLECAQCHNHPFAKWKREEFWGYAAFFAGVPGQTNDDGTPMARPARDAALLRELKIPGTSTVVKATNLDHSAPNWRPRAETREVLAEWITAPENPYFAKAAVNRTWARFFGVGLIDPVDDLDAGGDEALLALLDELAVDFRNHRYDLKYLIRALMATRAYNLSSATTSGESTPPANFARMPVRGLSPGQFLDSLSQATGNDLGDARARFLELFADRDETPTESKTSILQALTLMNGSFLERATNPETGEILGAIAGAPYLDTAGRVEMIYLAALTRRPRPEELSKVVGYIDRHPTEAERSKALADAFWALLNGPEFRINH
jgi:hypothetical protein